jgi:hypothetical protein
MAFGLTVEQLLQIIGEQHTHIRVLQSEIAALRAKKETNGLEARDTGKRESLPVA